MGFEESIASLIKRVPQLVEILDTEEATKTALVMPFLAALGYDVFDPAEVVPEFTADVGTKKGEKVDYAVVQDGDPVMLVECKKAGMSLEGASIHQLFRYFSVTPARIALVTNGIQYRFFADLEKPNLLDSRPFLELDLLAPQDTAIKEVQKLAKGSFNLETMLSSATELKYTNEIKRVFAEQLEEPDEELVRFFFKSLNPGASFTASVRDQFTGLVKRAFQQFVSERVSGRLRSALEREDREAMDAAAAAEEEKEEPGIVTTDEELEGYYIVKAIVSQVVDPDRVFHRDTKSYMGILLDDNNRKSICRLWFNTKQKYVGIFNEEKNEKRVPIETTKDIFLLTDFLRDTVQRYDEQESESK